LLVFRIKPFHQNVFKFYTYINLALIINENKKAVLTANNSEFKAGSIVLRAYDAFTTVDNIEVKSL